MRDWYEFSLLAVITVATNNSFQSHAIHCKTFILYISYRRIILILLRLLADMLCYLVIGLLVYWYFTEDITALWIAIVAGILSAILFLYTSDVKRSRRYDRNSIWDWLSFIDFLEIPFSLFRWIFMSLWRIFD